MDVLELRYGMNPHQRGAKVSADSLPFTVLNGQVGYINLLDALNAWQLVRELRQATGLPAATSFKHVSPAGAAVAVPLTQSLRESYFVGGGELSPLATAYARARGADRVSSFGDWIALSDRVDVATAELIRREVSDGVIAPDYEPEALAILRRKKDGGYRILQIEGDYEPPSLTQRELFGVLIEQERNNYVPSSADFSHIVTAEKTLPIEAQRDMIVAQLSLKYTQSNSVCFVKEGQLIGMGAGQQSRIHCTRLAGQKAAFWWLRQHPRSLSLPFRPKIGRPDRDNAIDQFLLDELSPAETTQWQEAFTERPQRLSKEEKRQWLDQLDGVVLASDAFFPFRDSIDAARQVGTRYVIQPGGSLRDDAVIAACDEYGMTMLFTGVRLFHH